MATTAEAEVDWSYDERTRLLPRSGGVGGGGGDIYTHDLEILDTESVGSNIDKKPCDVPITYAEQIFMEPISVGAWQMPEMNVSNGYLDDDENKDIVSFVFILLILVFCVVIIFYPFSYYDDDTYE